MHILHVTPYYAPAYAFGGVTRSVEGMTRALARRGQSITVLTTDAYTQTSRCPAPTEEVVNGVQVVRCRNLSVFLRGRLNLSTPLGLRRRAQALLPDVDLIHCHEFRTTENLLVAPLTGYKPLALSPHGTLSLRTGRGGFKSLWDKLLSPGVAGHVREVIGLTEAEVDEARGLWDTFHVSDQPYFSAVPNGVDVDDYRQLSGGTAFRQRYGLGDAPICLFMGRLHPRKGIGVLVEAFRQAALPDARLVIVGPDEGMLATIQPLLDERMIVTGYLGGTDRLAAFDAADMLALPAVGEGLPMVVLEAMAAGLPVMVSPGCNLPEVASFGAGVEVEAVIEPLAEGLRTLLSDEAKRRTMGASARALVEARFTWDAVAERLEGVYTEMQNPPNRH